MKSIKKNVVFSCAFGYKEADILPFVLSAGKAKIDAEIILLRRESDKPLNFDSYELNGLTVKTAAFSGCPVLSNKTLTGKIKRKAVNMLFRAASLLPVGARRPLYRLTHPTVGRIFMYSEYLNSVSDVENVLIIDCRDIYFQSDPFSYLNNGGLIVAEEDSVIGVEPANTYWVNRLSLVTNFDNFEGEHCLCSGVIIGGTKQVLALLTEMQNMILQSIAIVTTNTGFDQGIMNILLRSKRVADVTISAPGHAPIAHLGWKWEDYYRIDSSIGLVYKDSGKTVPILHQFDRVGRISDDLSDRLGVKCARMFDD